MATLFWKNIHQNLVKPSRQRTSSTVKYCLLHTQPTGRFKVCLALSNANRNFFLPPKLCYPPLSTPQHIWHAPQKTSGPERTFDSLLLTIAVLAGSFSSNHGLSAAARQISPARTALHGPRQCRHLFAGASSRPRRENSRCDCHPLRSVACAVLYGTRITSCSSVPLHL